MLVAVVRLRGRKRKGSVFRFAFDKQQTSRHVRFVPGTERSHDPSVADPNAWMRKRGVEV
jgi:hypothetical protein